MLNPSDQRHDQRGLAWLFSTTSYLFSNVTTFGKGSQISKTSVSSMPSKSNVKSVV